RTTAVIILCWVGAREVTVACKMSDAGLVATNSMPTWLDGPDDTFAAALMTEGPALSEQMLTVASPLAFVVALIVATVVVGQVRVVVKFPRVAKKLMVCPTWFTPAWSQCMVTVWGVFNGTCAAGAGTLMTKLSALIDRVVVVVTPGAVTWMVSVPAKRAVTSTVAWPFTSVIT